MDLDAFTQFDRDLIHALIVAPRAPFRHLGAVLGASDQTVARRYRRLQTTAGLRVTGQIESGRVGGTNWFVRLQCTPDAALGLAQALAQRPDTAWVRLASGGTEINCVVHNRAPGGGGPLLIERLAGARRIVGISAHSILHTFSPVAWPRVTTALSPDQVLALGRPALGRPALGKPALGKAGLGKVTIDDRTPQPAKPKGTAMPPAFLDAGDETLLELLAHDGRATPARLAAATGWHESTVRRRVASLIDDEILFFDVDFDERAMGITTNTTLWASVEPAELQAVGQAMATHPEVPFVAATTGPTNLLASVLIEDTDGLFDYLTTRISRIRGVRHIETSPVFRTVKRAGPVLPT